jgi:replicative DNA helicase
MNNLQKRIEEGLEGKYKGLDNGFNRLNELIFGVQRKCYTLIGGMSGTFKTTLLDFIVLNAIESAKAQNIKLDIFYYSFEIDELTKQCNWLSQLAYKNYGRVIKPEKIKGLGKNRLSSDEKEIINSLIPEVEDMFKNIKFTFSPTNPTGIYNEIFSHCRKNGNLLFHDYLDESGNTQQGISGFLPSDDRYTLVLIDHLYLLKKERGFSTKENMDKMSEYLIYLRNLFNITPIVVQQFNQGLSSTDRAKFKGVDLSPSQTDFKDTTNPYQDCDIALGLMSPYKLDMASYGGYDISILKDKMVSLKVIKNRLSRDGVSIGLYVKAESGSFEELPKSDDPELIKYYKQ